MNSVLVVRLLRSSAWHRDRPAVATTAQPPHRTSLQRRHQLAQLAGTRHHRAAVRLGQFRQRGHHVPAYRRRAVLPGGGPINKLAERRASGQEPKPKAPSEEILLLREIRDALAGPRPEVPHPDEARV